MSSKIALIIPALNEAKNLEWILPELTDPNLEETYRIVVVDNGSTDATFSTAKSFTNDVLTCEKRGYGAAVLTGIDFLQRLPEPEQPEVIIVFDADGTSPAKDIPQIFEPILGGQYDFVLGQRTRLEKGAMPIHAKFGNWLAVTLIGLFTGVFYKDMGPLRGLRFRCVRALKMQDLTWGWNVEMQVKAALLGMRINELDIHYKRRLYGKSKISGSVVGSIRAGTKIIVSVFKYFVLGCVQSWFVNRKIYFGRVIKS